MIKTKNKSKQINRGLVIKKMKENAFVQKGRKKIWFNLSPDFIDEYIQRIFDGIEINISSMCEYVYETSDRKTLMVKWDNRNQMYVYNDVVQFFSKADASTIKKEC